MDGNPTYYLDNNNNNIKYKLSNEYKLFAKSPNWSTHEFMPGQVLYSRGRRIDSTITIRTQSDSHLQSNCIRYLLPAAHVESTMSVRSQFLCRRCPWRDGQRWSKCTTLSPLENVLVGPEQSHNPSVQHTPVQESTSGNALPEILPPHESKQYHTHR